MQMVKIRSGLHSLSCFPKSNRAWHSTLVPEAPAPHPAAAAARPAWRRATQRPLHPSCSASSTNQQEDLLSSSPTTAALHQAQIDLLLDTGDEDRGDQLFYSSLPPPLLLFLLIVVVI